MVQKTPGVNLASPFRDWPQNLAALLSLCFVAFSTLALVTNGPSLPRVICQEHQVDCAVRSRGPTDIAARLASQIIQTASGKA